MNRQMITNFKYIMSILLISTFATHYLGCNANMLASQCFLIVTSFIYSISHKEQNTPRSARAPEAHIKCASRK